MSCEILSKLLHLSEPQYSSCVKGGWGHAPTLLHMVILRCKGMGSHCLKCVNISCSLFLFSLLGNIPSYFTEDFT